MNVATVTRSSSVRIVGGLFSSDFLSRVVRGDSALGGLTPEAYHLAEGERVNEVVSRSWTRLLATWVSFRRIIANLRPEDPGTGLTREKWLHILFQELGYGRLPVARAIKVETTDYPVSHLWERLPIHLVGVNVDLDRRMAGVAGAARRSPHGLVQELLNRSGEFWWGIVSNGRVLRLLKNNQSLTRQSYLEFDLESMMEGENYADFVILWLTCHESRFEGESGEGTWADRWLEAAQDQGIRALDALRTGVEAAIRRLGSDFLEHPANGALRESLRAGTLTPRDYYHQLLRLVYRFIFLLVTEERGLLLLPDARGLERERYTRYYSFNRIRELAIRRRGTSHSDLWKSLQVVMNRLGSDEGCLPLGLPALGSMLWSHESVSSLLDCELTNESLLSAVRLMALIERGGALSKVDFRNLGPEELGGIYESLLELEAVVDTDIGVFDLQSVEGHERHTTGSYYTTSSVVEAMLDSSLDPLLDGISHESNPDRALLNLRICDPACGSGHFLIAVAHRLASRLASYRASGLEPSPALLRASLRDVVSHCVFGVDINPMAVELCKVSLWLEAMEPGFPLTFLDHHIQTGNSLLGCTTNELLEGIPDKAFRRKDGDESQVCRRLTQQNSRERAGQLTLSIFEAQELPLPIYHLVERGDRAIQDVHSKERSWQEYIQSEAYRSKSEILNAWCVAFVLPHRHNAPSITTLTLRELSSRSREAANDLIVRIQAEAGALSLFHWDVAFPEVFGRSGPGGFDLVLGNPPWVRQELFRPWKPLLRRFDGYSSTADLSVFFVELGLRLCRDHRCIAFLTPDKWFRAAYGSRLRALTSTRSEVLLLVDFGHTRTLFRGKDTFPAIVVSKKEHSPSGGGSFRALRFQDFDHTRPDVRVAIREQTSMVSASILSSSEWVIEGPEVLSIINKIRASSVPLNQYIGRPPLLGIKTGLNRAFYIPERMARELGESGQYRELLRPLLRGRDLRAWTPSASHLWQIVIPSSENRRWPWSDKPPEDAERAFAEAYPRIHQHLKPYQDPLQTRSDIGRYWWELRSCDYYDVFARPKTLVPAISYQPGICIDRSGAISNNSTMVLATDDRLVVGAMNSSVGWWYMTKTFPHKKDEALAMDGDFLSRFPVPTTHPEVAEQIRRLVGTLERAEGSAQQGREQLEALSSLVAHAYGLTEAECDYLSRNPVPRDPLGSGGDTPA